MAVYGVVETTKVTGLCYDMQNATTDIENGWVVAKGDLISGERNIYAAGVPAATDEVFLVANPAWSYSSDPNKQGEDQFINVKGKAFRTYGLNKHNKFGVKKYSISSNTNLAVGDYIGVDGTTMKLKDLGTSAPSGKGFVGKVVEVYDDGIFPCINVSTATVPAGDPPTGGGVIVADSQWVIIEVITNETVVSG